MEQLTVQVRDKAKMLFELPVIAAFQFAGSQRSGLMGAEQAGVSLSRAVAGRNREADVLSQRLATEFRVVDF